MAVTGDLVTNLVVNSKQFGSGLRKSRSELSGFVSSAKSLLVPVAGLVAGTLGGRESVNAARTQEAAERKLGAVLKATGNAAGLSAQQIKQHAAALQDVTDFGDEATIAGSAILATFKEVKENAFLDAMELAQDMSAVMDQDLKGSVIQLGKALNDPIKGVSALSDVGVSFTDQQKEQIKALQESGDMLGAQAVILNELRSEFGGSAKAMADPWTQMNNIIGDVGENIGFTLLPSIRELYAGMKDGLGPLTSNVDEFKELGEWLGSGVRVIVDYGKHVVAAAFAVGTLVAVTNAVRVAQMAYAKSLLLVQALSGPKGWATASAGLGLYAVAVAQMTPAFGESEKAGRSALKAVEDTRGATAALADVRRESDAVTDSLKQQGAAAAEMMGSYRDSASELRVELDQIRQMVASGELTAEQGEFFSNAAANQATGIQDRMQSLREEIALLKGEANETAIEIARLYEKGAPLPLLNDLQQLMEQRDQLKRDQEEAKAAAEEQQRLAKEAAEEKKANQNKGIAEELAEAKKRAEDYADSLKTPLEKFKEQIADYDLQVSLGNLTQSQRDALVARDQREFDRSQGADRATGPNTALDAGSSESLSLFARAFSGEGTLSIQERSARTQERIEAHQERIAELIARQNEQLARAVGKKPKVAKMG